MEQSSSNMSCMHERSAILAIKGPSLCMLHIDDLIGFLHGAPCQDALGLTMPLNIVLPVFTYEEEGKEGGGGGGINQPPLQWSDEHRRNQTKKALGELLTNATRKGSSDEGKWDAADSNCIMLMQCTTNRALKYATRGFCCITAAKILCQAAMQRPHHSDWT